MSGFSQILIVVKDCFLVILVLFALLKKNTKTSSLRVLFQVAFVFQRRKEFFRACKEKLCFYAWKRKSNHFFDCLQLRSCFYKDCILSTFQLKQFIEKAKVVDKSSQVHFVVVSSRVNTPLVSLPSPFDLKNNLKSNAKIKIELVTFIFQGSEAPTQLRLGSWSR